MRWRSMRRSRHVRDVRARRGMGRGGLKLGLGGVIAVVVIGMLLGQDPFELLGTLEQPRGYESSPEHSAPAPQDEAAQFVAAVLGDTEDTWGGLFGAQSYQPPRLVLFREAVDSACGFATAAVGPFYCPGDAQVYLDLSFFEALHQRFGAPGDFAQAYVIAHEVGHHVQNLLGISDQVAQRRAGLSAAEGNALSVRLELQADCFAGVWGHYAAQRGLLEGGDVQEGLAAAAAIGDDRLQRDATGRIAPESFTHGSSEQRVHWFGVGLESGDPERCDTFAVATL